MVSAPGRFLEHSPSLWRPLQVLDPGEEAPASPSEAQVDISFLALAGVSVKGAAEGGPANDST